MHAFTNTYTHMRTHTHTHTNTHIHTHTPSKTQASVLSNIKLSTPQKQTKVHTDIKAKCGICTDKFGQATGDVHEVREQLPVKCTQGLSLYVFLPLLSTTTKKRITHNQIKQNERRDEMSE